MRREEAGKPTKERFFAVARQERVAKGAQRQRGYEQERPALDGGKHRQKRNGQRLDRGAQQGLAGIQDQPVDDGSGEREEQRGVGRRLYAAGKRHHASARRPAAEPNSSDFAASTAPEVISTQAAMMLSVGSAKPAMMSTSVESSGAA